MGFDGKHGSVGGRLCAYIGKDHHRSPLTARLPRTPICNHPPRRLPAVSGRMLHGWKLLNAQCSMLKESVANVELSGKASEYATVHAIQLLTQRVDHLDAFYISVNHCIIVDN